MQAAERQLVLVASVREVEGLLERAVVHARTACPLTGRTQAVSAHLDPLPPVLVQELVLK